MDNLPRLIEHAFPLKQASLDSVHEKNVRHGHISTLHIWPARRPLAACRAALIATLLPDPSALPKPEDLSDEEWQKEIIRRRKDLCEKIGGKVIKKIERKRMPSGQIVEREKEITEGGILHWGREIENKEILEWFRKEIKKAYGGRFPKVLDPFAGGGAIPLEAMRLGCEATAVDINPVAWFILKCTLEYPQKLAGKTWPLPEFILSHEDFMREFLKKAKGYEKKEVSGLLERLGTKLKKGETRPLQFSENETTNTEADLSWHIRAWGQWILDRARQELAEFYPTYADFEPPNKNNPKPYEKQPMKLVPLNEDGRTDVDGLNAEFSEEYLADGRNPRWIEKQTVAYLWARTVECKNCRATIPLLKTRWLCKKDRKRVLLTMEPNKDKTGVVFGIETNVPVKGGNAAQRREHDKRISTGTMSRSGAKCPCCGTIMTREDLQQAGLRDDLGEEMTVAIVGSLEGKEYRLPTPKERYIASITDAEMLHVFRGIPYGIPEEKMTADAKGNTWCILYGVDKFSKLFSRRQLLSLGTFAKLTRHIFPVLNKTSYPDTWIQAILTAIAICVDRVADRNSKIGWWQTSAEKIGPTFTHWALPMTWDFAEISPGADVSGGYGQAVEWVAEVAEHLTRLEFQVVHSSIFKTSAVGTVTSGVDVIITDPPYYDSIGYSVLMDYYYVWLRRTLSGLFNDIDASFTEPLAPKWDLTRNDGELVDDASRFGWDKKASREAYENGMYRAFVSCREALSPHGYLVIVFAHKNPEAWETLVSAIIRAGFIVRGSWPIQTERVGRTRSVSSAALSSSVWLVCKKRQENARPGWDNHVLEEMRKNIHGRLREFWDAGIRGPDFVWAATGPALEAYSKHPVVKKANDPGRVMTVSEFLRHVRRIVVDFVVGRVLSGDGEKNIEEAAADKLDEPTAYYLLHRHDFGLDEAPAGACILYAISCGISDRELAVAWDLIGFTKGKSEEEIEVEADVDAETDPNAEEDSGGKVKLKTWAQRKGRSMGYEAPGGKPVPLIDRVHRLMHLWKAGDLHKVDEYLDENGLRRHDLFRRLLQSIIELSPLGSEERSLLESISNHIQAKGAVMDDQQRKLALDIEET